MSTPSDRLKFYRLLVAEIAPEDLEFVSEYQRAVESEGADDRALGPEFGLTEGGAVLLGPVVIIIGKHLMDIGLSWLGAVSQKIIEGYIVDKGKAALKKWVDAPATEKLGPALTDKGKIEIIAVVSKLAQESKLSPDEARKAVEQVVRIVIGEKA